MGRAHGMPIVLLTNDAEHRRRALAEGIQAVNVQVRLNRLAWLHAGDAACFLH